MKIFFIFLFMLTLSSSAWAQYAIEKSPIVISVNKGVIPVCCTPACADSISCTLHIKRNKNQTVLLLIPNCCTNSAIELTTEIDYYKYKNKPDLLDWATKKRDWQSAVGGQPLNLNLTWLDDGNYIARYLADCGGLLKIVLATE
jgi:hypothetical protein